MGGQQGSRGYLYQSVISIFTACVENTWDYISVEYTTKQDKVDIALNSMDGEVIKAIQVKSSINLFTKESIISWLKDIINDVDAQEYQLVLIGNCEKNANTFIKSIGKYYHDASLDNETETSLGAFVTELKKKNIKVTLFPYEENHFLSVTRDALFRFISAKGYIIDFSILESICHALISLSMFLSTKGSSISRAEYESKIINWLIASANGGIKTNTKYSALTINVVNQKDSLLQKTGNSVPFCELPGLLNYRNRILESGMSLILEIKKIELNKFDESCIAESPTTVAPSLALEDRFKGIDWNRFAQARSAEWGNDEKNRTKENIQKYWGTTVDDCFFYVGNLMESSLLASMTGRNELK